MEAHDGRKRRGLLVLPALNLVLDELDQTPRESADHVGDRGGPLAHQPHAHGLRHLRIVGLHGVQRQSPAHKHAVVQRPLGQEGPHGRQVVAHERRHDVLLQAALREHAREIAVAADEGLELLAKALRHEADAAEGRAPKELGAGAEHHPALVQVNADVALAHAALASVHHGHHKLPVVLHQSSDAGLGGHALARLAADNHVHDDAAIPG
mmetsp:Transcript_111252/g.346792  ORF Transcript_111252/g.346792 Transcript_111252/m.346792 type:complete len:210 (+) Transcript_111252:436-1065(+)